MTRGPTSLRDNPTALLAALLGLMVVLFGLGFLTVHTGVHWAQLYARRETRILQP